MTENFDYGALIGGVGLFLLGMTIMTEGLKSASGPLLVKVLEKSTNTRFKGFLSGFLVTTILQSSTATTLLTIGFVNAGILSFAGSLWLLFGANVGTTMTGWLVALVGLKIKVEIFALPMVGLGVAMQMMSKKVFGAIGGIVVGFGILFLGISFLQESFTNAENVFNFSALLGHGIWSMLAFLGAGLVLTLIMQSSTAATAVILTLANTIDLPLQESASAVIGANVGTTITAMLATIGATANAKRSASAHILFNVVAGVVAFVILPFFVHFLDWILVITHLENSIAIKLALFHTSFNFLGVLLMIPLAGFMASFLSKRFTANEVKIEKPVYLDENLLNIPSLAIESLLKEMDRYRDILVTTARGFISHLQDRSSILPKVNKLDELGDAITDFITRLNRSSMSKETAEKLSECLRIRSQYSKSTDYLKRLISNFKDMKSYKNPVKKELDKYLLVIDELLEYIDTPIGTKPKSISNRKLNNLDDNYQKIKSLIVKSTINDGLSIHDMEDLVRLSRTLRAIIRSFAKAQKVIITQKIEEE